MSDRLDVLPQYLLPKRALTAFAGFIAARRSGARTTRLIRWFVAKYGVDMTEAADPEVAHAESYTTAYLRRRDEGGVEWLDLFAGRYVDRFERRAGTWRIARRVVVHDWSVSTRLDAEMSFPLPMEGFTQGRRDRSDIVFGA